MTPEDLDSLRAELDALDRELVGTIARRLRTVARIAEAKRAAGRPVFDRTREQAVLARARDNARAAGVPESVAETVMQTVVDAAHAAQDEALNGAGRVEAAEARRFLIIGGRGRMGQRLDAALERRGHTVVLHDVGDGDPAPAAATADVTIISVPMAHAATVAAAVGPHVRPDAVLCDINSLKVDVCAAMARSSAGEAVGLHPMFGPSVRTLRRQKVVVCPVRPGPGVDWWVDELARLGMETLSATPADHDRMMAVVQVLTHFRTLSMGAALRRTGIDLKDSLRFTSPIYRLELAFTGRLFAQDPDLYAEIEMQNPFGPEMRRAFLEAAQEMATLADAGDRDGFRAAFRATASWFGGFEAESMALSDAIIDMLCGRA